MFRNRSQCYQPRSRVQTVAVGAGEFYTVRSLSASCCRSGAALNGMVVLAGKLCDREDAGGEFLVFKHECV